MPSGEGQTKIKMGNLLPKTKELSSESHRALSMVSLGYSDAQGLHLRSGQH